jgi:outer membrane receptor protein involved in Fe transport
MKQNYYGIFNAKIGLIYDNWTFEFWGKNITDQQYYTFYFESLSKNFFQLSKPFQFGINVKYSLFKN